MDTTEHSKGLSSLFTGPLRTATYVIVDAFAYALEPLLDKATEDPRQPEGYGAADDTNGGPNGARSTRVVEDAHRISRDA